MTPIRTNLGGAVTRGFSQCADSSEARIILASFADDLQYQYVIDYYERGYQAGIEMSEKQGVILVVDDEEVVRNLLRRVLQEADHDVVTAAMGRKLWKKCHN